MSDVAPSSVSTSTVISTLTANLIVFAIFIGCFLFLRLPFKRIYSPKSSFDLVEEDKKPEPLPKDPFRWVFILLTKPQSFILQQAGLDGYFFLRYLKIFAYLFLGGLLTYIILLPINATNGNGNKGFDQLSIANVVHRQRYYAHVFVGWVWYGIVIFVIYRELFFYNSLRNVVLSSPKYAKKNSSRTVLFQSVPDELLDEKQFFKIFNGVKRIYVCRSTKELESKVEERIGLVNRLEAAENKLLKQAVKKKLKADKKGEPIEPADEISAYVPEGKRPRMKEGGFFSRKVDTIRHCHKEIERLNKEIRQLQKGYRHFKPMNSIFVEFENQYYAQLAFQSTVHHNPLRMKPSYIGIEPSDVKWSNMRLFWWERIARRFGSFAAIIAVIVFWAIPVAFVGVISNITFLTNKLPWLRWILRMPPALFGVVTGLLPTALLAILMMLLPMFIRGMAIISGSPSVQAIEMYTQRAYFGFLMVNGFLVTALASSATATVTKIVEQPTSAMSILANKLPLSSNFYISYLILQGLSVASASLFQIVGLFLYYILGALLDGTVRKKWARFSGLGTCSWGTVFPVFTQLACITLAYSIISPLIIAFACVAFFLIYIAYCYNLTYVFVESPDNRGMHYPVALFQTFTGIYLGQICMLGIFAVGKGWGPIVLQVIGIVTTVFLHVHLKEAFDHLLTVIPVDCMKALDGHSDTPSYSGHTEYHEKVLNKRRKRKEKQEYEEEQEEHEHENSLSPDLEKVSTTRLLADRDFKRINIENPTPLLRFVRPDVFLNFRHAKSILPSSYMVEPAEAPENKHTYHPPAISAKCPGVWIPRDPMGLSDLEIDKLKSVINISNENAGFDEKGGIIYLGKPPN
ncbi:uncharacterized protein SPAPADRAFT_56937 [Spathaspora passalidarum NRRL Y-27907]|uniref:DUF221-domain-containing protein n=1 Tax=Spathaspora passalidarum (strain NRRL Y-27907 / 11-Y1) TaxID=619300 RepID=G3AS48_SPAPN|nr:uncharacterized protein SPAPADRAFT_56937 [Spathaspora passalidarum NRRL Y-27907]EGW31007.1 hypothetical protein SPAPADRAFT_56937 [Spathaspora passalidarum NRRL Y-27907]